MIGPRTKAYTARVERKALAVAKTANTKVNKVIRGIEEKYYDVNYGAISIDWTGNQYYLLNTPSVGTTGLTRVGDTIFVKRLQFMLEASVGSAASTLRMILFWDKDMIVSNATQLLSVTGTASSVTSQYNFEYRKNYSVFFDKTYVLDSTDKSTYCIHKNVKVNKSSIFSGSGGITLRKGGLRLCLISNKTPGATCPSFIMNQRVIFTD